jgi:LPS export ABC transporter protein LptC
MLSANSKSFYTLALLFVLCCACENDKSKVDLITRKINLPVETAGNIEVLYSDSAILKVKMTAPAMNRFTSPKPYVEMPKGVDINFFDDSLHIISTLTANYAISRESEDIMEARNNVIVVNQKGEKLNTEHLIWNKKTRKIYSNVFAKITTKDEIIYGNGFEANEDFSKYKINQVKGIISVNKDNHAPHP